MMAKKDYAHLCGLDFSEHAGPEQKAAPSSLAPSSSSADSNPPIYAGIGLMNAMVSLLYFCNQRPGIFVAPYLLLQGIAESRIGFVLFISGITALVLQTPAGQMVDELHNKTRIVIIGNLATILGCLLLSNFSYIGVVTVAVTINVVTDVFVFPSLYATTLGIFGSEGMEKQAALNETGTHSGNATFAIIAGVIVVFTTVDASSIFYVCAAMRCVGICIVVFYVSTYKIDFNKSRGLVDIAVPSPGLSMCDLECSTHSKDSLASITLIHAADQPLDYSTLLTDRHVLVFLVSVAMFHFANAAMLPLLSQQLFINNSDKGFAFAAAAVITAQVSMVGSASMAGCLVPKIGTKPLFICALLAIPVRGVLIVLLLQASSGPGGGGGGTNALLLSTQVLDGLAGGIFGVLLVLITENLSRGSGRFAMLLGLAKTAEGVGASFSNLVGEVLAEYWGYAAAFLFLSAASLLPVVLYSLGMPSAQVCDEAQDSARRVQDNLSVASHHGSTHSLSVGDLELPVAGSWASKSVPKAVE